MAPPSPANNVSAIPKEFERYRYDPRAFIEEILWVLDRDQPGVAVPFKLRPIQLAFLQEIQKRRAFNIWRSAKRAGKPALDIIKTALKKLPTSAKTAAKAIAAFGPDLLLERFPKDLKVDDGPVAFIIGKPRQVGFTTLIEAILIWRAVFHPNFKAVLMAHEGDSVQNVLTTTKNFILLWPDDKTALKPEVPRNATTKVVFGNGATFSIKTAGGLESRGFKEDAGHFSEFAHYPNGNAVAASLIASPKHFWYFIESTANGKTGTFYDFYTKSTTVDALIDLYDQGRSLPQRTTTKFFIDWRTDPEYHLPLDPGDAEHIEATLSDYEKSIRAAYDLSLEQLKWRRYKIENAAESAVGLTPEGFFAQEYPLSEDEMFQQVGSEVFDAAMLARQKQMAAENKPIGYFRLDGKTAPLPLLQPINANLTIWKRPEPNELYVIGADPAIGLSHGDYCWASVFSIGDGTVIRQVAEFRGRGPLIDQKSFAHIVVFLAEYYNKAFVVPEVNQGLTLCNTIVTDCGYTNIYSRKALDQVIGEQNAFRFGFMTTGASRPHLINEMVSAFRGGNLLIRSLETLEQMAIFTRNELGKPQAPEGKHDDAVFAAALANFGFPPHRGGPSLIAKRLREQKAAESGSPPAPSGIDAHEQQLIEAVERMANRERDRLRRSAKRGLASDLILL